MGGGPMGGPPMGAPPPKKNNTALFAMIGIAAFAVLGGSCALCVCVGKSASTTASSSGGSSGGNTAPAGASWITSEKPYVKFLSPPGWNKDLKGDWGVFKSPDGNAVFAFTTFDRPGESTVRLGKAAGVLGVSGINWGSPTSTTIGRDNFPARMGEGTCDFKGPGGYIWYATVNSGTSDQILLIYTVSAMGTKAHKDAALTSIKSLQNR